MGFLNGLGKMLQGKPVFSDENNSKSNKSDASNQDSSSSQLVDSSGAKMIPNIEIKNTKSYINGKTMEVTGWVTNTSQVEIELDKIVMIGQKTELDQRLNPGQGRECKFYRGPTPVNESASKANLFYKIMSNGDYFCADFRIEYNRESDGSFTVEDFHPERDVRDV